MLLDHYYVYHILVNFIIFLFNIFKNYFIIINSNYKKLNFIYKITLYMFSLPPAVSNHRRHRCNRPYPPFCNHRPDPSLFSSVQTDRSQVVHLSLFVRIRARWFSRLQSLSLSIEFRVSISFSQFKASRPWRTPKIR